MAAAGCRAGDAGPGRGELAAGTVDSWLVAKLTGGRAHVTDHTNASRTLLYDLRCRDLGTRSCCSSSASRPKSCPPWCASSGVVEQTDPDHLGFALPIAGLAGDQQAALFGQGCVYPGLAKNTYGTGAFLLVLAGDRVPSAAHGLLATAACGAAGEPAYALEGSVFVAGAAVQWLRDGLGLIDAGRRDRRRWPGAYPTPAGSTSSQRSSGWARRTGSRTPGERSPV